MPGTWRGGPGPPWRRVTADPAPPSRADNAPGSPCRAQLPDGTHREELPLERRPLPPTVTKHLPVPLGLRPLSCSAGVRTAIDLGDNVTGSHVYEAINSRILMTGRCLLSTFPGSICSEAALQQMELRLFSFPSLGPGPSPTVVGTPLVWIPLPLVQGAARGPSSLPGYRGVWGWGAHCGEGLGTRGGVERAISELPPLEAPVGLVSPPWRAHAVIMDPASRQQPLPEAPTPNQTPFHLEELGRDRAGLLVHKDESSEHLLAAMPRESKLVYV